MYRWILFSRIDYVNIVCRKIIIIFNENISGAVTKKRYVRIVFFFFLV